MLTDNDAATAVIEACGGNVHLLKTELEIFVDQNTPLLMADEDRDTQPTLGFQRVLQRALFHVQSSGNGEVSGANVLVAIPATASGDAIAIAGAANGDGLFVACDAGKGCGNSFESWREYADCDGWRDGSLVQPESDVS